MEFDSGHHTEHNGRRIGPEDLREGKTGKESSCPALSCEDVGRLSVADTFGEAAVGQADDGAFARPVRDQAAAVVEQPGESRQLRISIRGEDLHAMCIEVADSDPVVGKHRLPRDSTVSGGPGSAHGPVLSVDRHSIGNVQSRRPRRDPPRLAQHRLTPLRLALLRRPQIRRGHDATCVVGTFSSRAVRARSTILLVSSLQVAEQLRQGSSAATSIAHVVQAPGSTTSPPADR